MRLIGAGDAVLSPSVTRRLLDLRARTLAPLNTTERDAALARVTDRELTVLRLVAHGLSNLEIAQTMDLAPSSVKTHVGHLLTKLGFGDRVQLVVFAYEHEVVRPRESDPVLADERARGPGRTAGRAGPLWRAGR